MKRLATKIKSWFIRPPVPPADIPAANQPKAKPALSHAQAGLVRDLLCVDGRGPESTAKEFYRRYPRSGFRHLWDKDETGKTYLTEPDLFTEGCELADVAMRVLGDVFEENGEEYIKTDSPFFEVMRRAVMG